MSDSTQPVFVMNPAPVPWPVDVRVPAPGGEFITQRFTALIHLLSEEEHAALHATVAQADGAPQKTEADHLADNARLFQRLIAGWDGVTHAGGTPLAFDAEALAAVVTGPLGKAVSAGLWQAVAEVRHGVRLGNFAAPPATG